MGDWVYYVTCMSFAEVDAWIKPTHEIHRNAKLSEWIQRQLDEQHANRIAKYIRSEKARLFNSIVVGVYGANPEWSELRVRDPQDRLSAQDEDHLKRSLGILTFEGDEHLFAVDGQHRVAGIKRAIENTPALATEEISVVLVAHVDSEKGRERTRRLFTTLNKKAKKVTQADIVALDEDNGFAVVARMLVDEFPLLKERDLVAFEGSAKIPLTNTKSLTTIIGLFELAKDLYPTGSRELPKRAVFQGTRPENTAIEEIYDRNTDFWTLLSKRVPEYKAVFAAKSPRSCGEFRTQTNNHLLFRPAGQRAFAGAVRIMLDRKPTLSMPRAIERLLHLDLWLQNDEWHHLLWDPFQAKMISENRMLAESHLLTQVGELPRSADAEKRYAEVIAKKKAGEFDATKKKGRQRRV